jgi:hypothetical protein
MEREYPECKCSECYGGQGQYSAVSESGRVRVLASTESRPPDSEVLSTLTAKLNQLCPACHRKIVMQDTVKLDQRDGVLIPYHVNCLPSRRQS